MFPEQTVTTTVSARVRAALGSAGPLWCSFWCFCARHGEILEREPILYTPVCHAVFHATPRVQQGCPSQGSGSLRVKSARVSMWIDCTGARCFRNSKDHRNCRLSGELAQGLLVKRGRPLGHLLHQSCLGEERNCSSTVPGKSGMRRQRKEEAPGLQQAGPFCQHT